MKKQNSIIAAVFLLVLLPGMLFSGGHAEIVPRETTVDRDAPVKLLFWVYPKWNGITGAEPNGQGGDWERAMAAKFMEQHSNVTIEVEVFDFKTGPEKVAIALASGQAGNVLHDSESRMFEYANDGFLLPVDEFLTEEEKNSYYDGALATTAIQDGRPYYLPFGTAPVLMMINRSLFEKAGCADLLPKDPERTWTMDEYYHAIKTATSRLNNVYGVPLFGNTTTGDAFTFIWIWAHGGKIVDTMTNKMAVNTVETKKGLAFWKRLIDEKLATPGGAGMKAGDVWVFFDQQMVLTAPAGTVNYARALAAQASGTANKFDIELVMMPVDEGVRQVSCGFPHGFAVFKNKDPNIQYWSTEFARFLASDENAGAVKAANEFSFKKSQSNLYADSPDPNMRFAVKAMEYQVPNGTSVVGYTRLRNEISPYMQQLYLGEISVDEFVEKVERVGNTLLESLK